jgi:hypothetical protein
MLADVKAAGVQALVCTTASNESGLAPLGEDDQAGLDAAGQADVARLVAAPPAAGAVDALRAAAARAPGSARTQFALARSLQASGDAAGARQAFLRARDLDTMPWRPTSQTEQAIRDAAAAQGAVLCDVAARFRDLSPEGATGWELLDDHVHPSLHGQAEVARARTGGDDHGVGTVFGAARGLEKDAPVLLLRDALDAVVFDAGTELLGLLLHPHHQVRAHDTLGETGEILDLRRRRELPTGLFTGNDERPQVGAGRVNRGGPTGAAGSDDDDIFHGRAMWRRMADESIANLEE